MVLDASIAVRVPVIMTQAIVTAADLVQSILICVPTSVFHRPSSTLARQQRENVRTPSLPLVVIRGPSSVVLSLSSFGGHPPPLR